MSRLSSDPIPKDSEICWQHGKVKLTRAGAKSTARRMNKKSRKAGNVTEYLCPGCGTWHVGNQRWK
jgi:hypothetical protein